MTNWNTQERLKSLIYNEIEPQVDFETFVKKILYQHYSTDHLDDIIEHLREEEGLENLDEEFPFVDEKVIPFIIRICQESIEEKFEDIFSTLKSIEETFNEVDLDFQITFVDNDSEVRSHGFNLMVANLLALVDEEIAHYEEIDDDTFRKIFSDDGKISELDLLESIYGKLENVKNILEPWKDQIEEYEINDTKSAKKGRSLWMP